MKLGLHTPLPKLQSDELRYKKALQSGLFCDEHNLDTRDSMTATCKELFLARECV